MLRIHLGNRCICVGWVDLSGVFFASQRNDLEPYLVILLVILYSTCVYFLLLYIVGNQLLHLSIYEMFPTGPLTYQSLTLVKQNFLLGKQTKYTKRQKGSNNSYPDLYVLMNLILNTLLIILNHLNSLLEYVHAVRFDSRSLNSTSKTSQIIVAINHFFWICFNVIRVLGE